MTPKSLRLVARVSAKPHNGVHVKLSLWTSQVGGSPSPIGHLHLPRKVWRVFRPVLDVGCRLAGGSFHSNEPPAAESLL